MPPSLVVVLLGDKGPKSLGTAVAVQPDHFTGIRIRGQPVHPVSGGA